MQTDTPLSPDMLIIHRSFSEKARRAAQWALDFITSHSLEPQPVTARIAALLQALGSALAYGGDAALALQLAQALHQPMIRAGLWSEWEPYVGEALALARRTEDRLAEFHLLCALGDVRALRGDWQAAMQPLQEAMPFARLAGKSWYLPFTRAAECQLNLGRPAEAQAVLMRALRRARRIDDTQAQMLILGLVGQARVPASGWRAAVGYFEAALALARQAGSAVQVLNNLNLLGMAYRELGRLNRARVCFDEALALSRRLGERSGEGVVLSNLGALYLITGDLESAQTALGAALAIHRTLGHPARTALTLVNMGRLGVQRNELTSAGGYLAEAVQIASTVPYPSVLARACWATGDYYQASGEVAVASLAYARAKVLFRQAGHVYQAARVGQEPAASG
jgi:tetratricopeptide (TPR) repeat protein